MSDYLNKTSELEEFFKHLGLDFVFLAENQDQLRELVKASIEADERFQKLPLFRRAGILGFIEGASKGTAKLVGSEGGSKYKGPTPLTPKKTEDVPRNVKKLQPGASWRRHVNGGGWVSDTAYVEASAHVGAKAVVYENARVTDRARIYGCAVVRGDAECYGTCHVHGLAVVEGRASVFDGARVLGKVKLGGTVVIGGTTLIRGSAVLNGNEELIDERVAPSKILGASGAAAG